MDYVVIKLINWRYSEGNTPDMKIEQDDTSRSMSLEKAIDTMNKRNQLIESDEPCAWSILSKDAYKHLVKTGMYKDE